MTDCLNPEAFLAAKDAAQEAFQANKDWHDVTTAMLSAYDKSLAAALPSPRTITTVEELEALPVGSVIADLYDDRGDAPIVLCKANNGEWAALTTGTRMGIPWWASRDIAHVARRLRVLHVPTEGGGE